MKSDQCVASRGRPWVHSATRSTQRIPSMHPSSFASRRHYVHENQDQPTPSEFTAWVKGPSGRIKNWALLHQMAAVMIFAAVVVLLILIAKPLLQGANTPFA